MNQSRKPFSQACENNRDPILAVLAEVFTAPATIMEIGSGTGQHAVHFARHLPHLHWQPTDVAANLPGIRAWLAEADLANIGEPLVLDLDDGSWPVTAANGAFSANTVHIVNWTQVGRLFHGLGAQLPTSTRFCLYGPFAYNGHHTSDSNARFDARLRERDPASGIRDLADLEPLAAQAGFRLAADYAMPANNRTLVWTRA